MTVDRRLKCSFCRGVIVKVFVHTRSFWFIASLCKANRGTYFAIDRMSVYSSGADIELRKEMTYV